MTDKEKLQQLYDQIESMKESNPITYRLWGEIFKTVKPQLDKYLEAIEETDSKVRTAGE